MMAILAESLKKPVPGLTESDPAPVLPAFGAWPMFQLGKSKYDLHTYGGRVKHFFNIIDPRTLFTSDAKLQECRKLLDDYKNGTLPPGVTDRELWEAQKIVQAIIHPDTGEKIPMPFRMSGYVPFGSPIVAGLLLPNPSLASIIFWQWLNQSHNACVNYCNRNATRPTPFSKFIEGYLGAVTSAVGVAVGLNQLVARAKSLSPTTRNLVQKFVPFPAVAIANVCNVFLMRRQELNTGIEVHDMAHNVIGISKIAAFDAIKDTALTRIVLPAPILTLPPLLMTMLEKTPLFKRYPRSYLPINATLGALSFGLALPLAIGLFPQESRIHRDKLEKELRERTKDEFLFYNKGL